MGAPSNRLDPFIRQLVAKGHEVFVATGMPNYPAGVVFPAYRKRRFMREQVGGFTIFRTLYFTAPRNQAKWSQLVCYLSFIPAAISSGLRAGKVDLVFSTSPPLFVALAGFVLAKLRGAKLVLDLRDLWPDEIIACGAGREGSTPVRILRILEGWAYRTADRVCCTTNAFINTVIERGVPSEKIVFLPNGADLELFHPPTANTAKPTEYPLGSRFVAMYSGVLGIKHGLEVVLQAARLLRDEENIIFFFVGDGARRKALAECAQEMQLDNVVFGGERSAAEIPYLVACADICLSSVLPSAYLENIISVKIFEYMACERPVVAAQAGETARVLQDSGGGIVVPPGDSRALADAILALYRDPERRIAMGKLGREYVEQHYSRSTWAARLEVELRNLCLKEAGKMRVNKRAKNTV